jgi:hypothetical protein
MNTAPATHTHTSQEGIMDTTYTVLHTEAAADGMWWAVVLMAGKAYGGAADTRAEAIRMAQLSAAEDIPAA